MALVMVATGGAGLAAGGGTAPVGGFLGGSQTDRVNAVGIDGSGNILLAGETASCDFPGGGAGPCYARYTSHAFVAKLNPSGTQVLYRTMLGGSGSDSARAIAVDAGGSAYVTGVTTSLDFPTTTGSLLRRAPLAGLGKAFVAKLSPSGGVVYATYLGGDSTDQGFGIAVDSTGAAYVAGSTTSVSFPVGKSAPQAGLAGASDCFVAKLNPAGAALVYATYLGGEGIDACKAIAVDGAGAAFVTGGTSSASFPTVSALKLAPSGGMDAFLTKISPAGDRFLFSTYLGGDGVDMGNAVQVGAAGEAYVGGDTTSTQFPGAGGAFQARLAGGYDGFVCAVSSDGAGVLFMTYLGGAGADSITGLALMSDGSLAVSGYTASMDFPVANAVQPAFGGAFDGFVAVLYPNATGLRTSTYIGGGGDDRAWGIAASGLTAVVGGQALSGTIPYLQGGLSAATAAPQYDGFFVSLASGPVAGDASLRFVPATPCRVADTRNPSGPFGGPIISGGSTRDFVIVASACGIPQTAQGFSLNITVVPSGPLGFLTIWPRGQNRPASTMLNSPDGRVKANATILGAGTGGAVSIYAADTTHVIIDVNGYFVPAADPAALVFYPLTPCRIADTREALGPLGGPGLTTGFSSRSIPVVSAPCGVPAAARAYSLNFTVVPGAPLGYLATWPTGQKRPLVSTLNSETGAVIANAAIVPAGTSGSIDVYASSNSHVIIDINGYFAPAGAEGLAWYPLPPCRALDTRQAAGGGYRNGTLDAPVGAVCGAPATARAYVLNATVVPASTFGYLALWPQGMAKPFVSTLNAFDGTTASNMALVPAANGIVSAYLTHPGHLMLDVYGYFGK